LRAPDGVADSGRDIRVLGARNREDEASARVAKEREVICDNTVTDISWLWRRRGQSKD